MKSLIMWLRVGGYVAGLAGAILMLTGQRTYGESRQMILWCGGACLVLMFALFFATYIIHFARMFSRPAPRPRGWDRPHGSPPPEPGEKKEGDVAKSVKTGIDRKSEAE